MPTLADVQPFEFYRDNWSYVLPQLGAEYREPDDSPPGWFWRSPDEGTGRIRFEDSAPVDSLVQAAPYRLWNRALNEAGYADEGSPADIAARASVAQYGEGQGFGGSVQGFLDYVRGAGSQLFYSDTQGRWLVKAGDPVKALNPTPIALPNTTPDGWRDFGVNAIKVVSTVYGAGNLLSYGLNAAGVESVAKPPTFMERFFSQAPAPVSDAVPIWNDAFTPSGSTISTASAFDVGGGPSLLDFATEANEAAAEAFTYTPAAADIVAAAAPAVPDVVAPALDLASEANEASAQALASGYTGSSAGLDLLRTAGTASTALKSTAATATAVRALTGGNTMPSIKPSTGANAPSQQKGGAASTAKPLDASSMLQDRNLWIAAAVLGLIAYTSMDTKGK